MTASTDVLGLVRRWSAAEEHNDAGGLDRILTGDFRVTLSAVRGDDQWRLASVHIGPLQALPPGSPGPAGRGAPEPTPGRRVAHPSEDRPAIDDPRSPRSPR